MIEASGGTLTLTNAVTGTGGLQIDANATLVLASSTATTDSATFNGAGATLKLNHTGNLSGAIGGIGLDDTFSLVGVTANAASVNGSNQLVVTENGTTVDTLQLSGTNSGFYFLTQAISGGTNVDRPADPGDGRRLSRRALALRPDPRRLRHFRHGGRDRGEHRKPQRFADHLDHRDRRDGHGLLLQRSSPTGPRSTRSSAASPSPDTAADISADLDQLTDRELTSITISDSDAVGVTVAQLTGDATADRQARQRRRDRRTSLRSSTPRRISRRGLDGLDGSNIASITISDNGAIGVSRRRSSPATRRRSASSPTPTRRPITSR